VKIVTGRADHALRLPAAALRFHPTAAAAAPSGAAKGKSKSGGRAAASARAQQSVYVLDQGKLKRMPVKLGLSDGNYTEILSGVSEGQMVVTGTAATSKTAAPAASQAAPGSRRLGF
jgi:HlyD family secretion protein